MKFTRNYFEINFFGLANERAANLPQQILS